MRVDQAENGGVILYQLQVTTCMSNMNNKEKYSGYYRSNLYNVPVVTSHLTGCGLHGYSLVSLWANLPTGQAYQAAVEHEMVSWL